MPRTPPIESARVVGWPLTYRSVMSGRMPAHWSDRSYWLGATPYEESPPLEGDRSVDVAVVGGGFTGLATAHFLKELEPSLDVAVLESEVVGFGASGRNGGFSMTLFGLTLGVTARMFGKRRAAAAHRYMEEAVETLERMVGELGIDSDYERPGFLRVATSPAYVKRIQEEIELAHELGLEGIEWIDADAVRAEVDSHTYLGAWSEPRCGLINPAKQARGLKAAVERQGVTVFERTPVERIDRARDGFTLHSGRNRVRAGRVVLATNAYSHLVPRLRRRQVPAFTHIVLTEPLSDEQLAEIGWRNRQGIETARNMVHYYRLTADNRLLMGGRDVSLTYGTDMERDHHPPTFAGLEDDVRTTFPQLRDVRFTHRWGGPVSIPVQMVPALGRLGDPRMVYSLGCMGHGVSLTHLNGRTLAELLLERETERTDTWFVDRRVIPWPPEPLRFAASFAVRGGLRLQDRFTDRVAGE